MKTKHGMIMKIKMLRDHFKLKIINDDFLK